MKEMTLYSIGAEQERINYLLEESGGEITPQIEEAILLNRENFLTKSEGYIATIQKYDDLSGLIDAEIKRLQSYKKTSANICRNLRTCLLSAMRSFGIDKAEVGLHRLSTRRSTSVAIDDEQHVPAKYIIVTTSPDKKAIGEALKRGEEVPGASLQQNVSLQIR